MDIMIIEPKKRKAHGFDRPFPSGAALIAWGERAQLPAFPHTDWHNPSFPTAWRGVSCRFHEAFGSDVWLDTMGEAVAWWSARHAAEAAEGA
jgi:hypothetical protein